MGRKQRGFQQQGAVNPLLMRQSTSQPTGPSIRDYLSRPRMSWEEVRQLEKEKDSKNKALEDWENNMENERKELDEYRKKIKKTKRKRTQKEGKT